jgi:hypothetical protein
MHHEIAIHAVVDRSGGITLNRQLFHTHNILIYLSFNI